MEDNNTKGKFVPYTESYALKELGFEENCFGFYNNADANVWVKQDIDESIKNIYKGDIQAPLYQEAFNWIYDKYKLFYMDEIGTFDFSFRIFDIKKERNLMQSILHPYGFNFNGSPEEARLEGLRVMIKKIQNEKQGKTS